MSSEQNKRHLEEMAAAVGAGDIDKYLDGLSDDIRWTIIGTTSFSGLYSGKQEVVDRLFGRLSGLLDGGLEVIRDRMIAEGDIVAVQARGRSKTKRGEDYNNTYCIVYRFEGGKVAEITEYLDTELVTQRLG